MDAPSETARGDGATLPSASRDLPRITILLMAISCAVAAANIYYNQPLLADFATYFRTDTGAAGLVATAAQVGYGVGLLLFVPLGDLYERRTIVLSLTYACVGLLVLMAVSSSLVHLIVAQALVGLTAVSTQLLIPLAVELSPPGERGRTIGTMMAGVLVGILLSRTVAGFVGDSLGWRAMFWIAAGLTLATAFVLQAVVPARPPTRRMPYLRLLRSLAALVRCMPAARNAALMSALSFAAFCAFWAELSFLMHDRFGLGAGAAGLFGLVGLGGAACAPLAGRTADAQGTPFVLTLALLITLASFVLMTAWVSIAGLVVGVLLLDMGVQATTVAAQSNIMAMVPEARNRLNTFYMVSRYAGGAIGSTLGTSIYAWSGWTSAGVLSIVMVLAALLLQAARPRFTGERGMP